MVRVSLHDSSPDWPVMFERAAQRIADALSGLEIEVHHTGSTSVPGLRAKPIIDITIGVPDSRNEDAYVPPLVAAGYVFRFREPHWHEHRFFKGLDPDVNLHVFTSKSTEIERMLIFRDQLRVDAADRALYESTKATLAERDWETVQHYADSKSDVVEEIIARAMIARRHRSKRR